MAFFEPILQENKDRFVIFPVKHHDIWDLYKEIEACFWTTRGMELHQDISDWNSRLSSDEKEFISHLLSFFASSNRHFKNLAGNLAHEIQYPEAEYFYSFQAAMEHIHSETYFLLLDTYLKEEKEKNNSLNAFELPTAIEKIGQWTQQWSKYSFAEKLVAHAAVEEIFFSGFAGSFSWLKKQELLPALTFYNDLITRDKGKFRDFAVHLHNNHLVHKVPKKRIKEIILEAAELEFEIRTQNFAPALIGMHPDSMRQYIQFVSDRLLAALDCEKEFGATEPFDSMDQERTSLLEKRVGELQKTGVTNKDQNNPISRS